MVTRALQGHRREGLGSAKQHCTFGATAAPHAHGQRNTVQIGKSRSKARVLAGTHVMGQH